MAFQQWEVQRFESAAIEMCNRMNLDPWASSDPMVSGSRPQWFIYAMRMAEHQLMVQAMRNFGHEA